MDTRHLGVSWRSGKLKNDTPFLCQNLEGMNVFI